ncbi:MAG: hypothetical protein ACHQ2F_07730 [Desulfobaccales bacterium]
MAERKLSFLYEEQFRKMAREEAERAALEHSSGEPPMDTHFEKYLDARFSHIDDNIKEIRTDIREVRGDIKGLKLWIIAAVIALATLFFTVVGYHTMVLQSQFQVFSEYVKAVTQPQAPKAPTDSPQ